MNNKKIYLLALLLLVCILSISTISATENTTNKEICNTNNKENNLETNNHYDDVSNSNNNDVELKEKKDTYNNDKQDKSGTDETTTTENEDPLSFTDLNITINGNSNSTIYLSNNYTYNDDSDSGFTAGILINRDLTIYGNGVTIDGNKMARIFNVTDSKLNVNFYNINFINGQAVNGGAIYSINNTYNVYNCTFTGNSGSEGGAIYKGNAYNCTFKGNTASRGGAMCNGKAFLCRFNGDTISWITPIPAIINVINYTSTYKSGERLKFNLTADDILFDGFNTTINIYKNGVLIKTVYGLTGEGWIVDLEPGEYTAELSLTDYPEENATNATITVSKEKLASKITANPISTAYYVSKYLVITLKDCNGNAITGEVLNVNLGGSKNYKTDVNGQVKIQVGTLIPKVYTAKISYAKSDMYNGSTSSVKVTVNKATPKITANAVKYVGNTKQFMVYFLTGHIKSHALKNTKVTLKVAGKTYSVKTNSKGQGVFNISQLKKGKYTAVLTVPANNCYNKVTRTVIMNVKK